MHSKFVNIMNAIVKNVVEGNSIKVLLEKVKFQGYANLLLEKQTICEKPKTNSRVSKGVKLQKDG